MNLLLDTHVWVWAQESPESLGRRARAALEDTENNLCLCAISAMEIARLVFLRKIHLDEPTHQWMRDSMHGLSVRMIDVTIQIATDAYRLPGTFHKDPVDRLLVAAARLHEFTLVTADRLILRYPHVKTLRAGL